jgi:ligand-binding sensor domain-containing protein
MRKNLVLFFLINIAASSLLNPALAQTQLWQSFTNMRSIRGYYEPERNIYLYSRVLASSPQGVWAATTGGLLLWDTKLKGFRNYKNTEGLSQNETKAIGRDRHNRIWIAQMNGLIDVYDPAEQAFSRIDDYRGRRIYDFWVKGDSMYIALDIGVSFYHVARREVRETYKNLGRRFNSEIPVTALFIDGRELWAATGSGIAHTFLDLPNLLAPESWSNYESAEGLPSEEVRGFAKFAKTMVAATANGAAAFNGQRWSDISGNLADRNLMQLLTNRENDKEVLYAATSSAVYRSETTGAWSLVGNAIPQAITGMIFDDAGTLWVATASAGLYEFDRSNQNWRLHEPEGPATNVFTGLALDQNGHLWCTSSNSGFQVFDGKQWYDYTALNSKIWPDVRTVLPLANDTTWFGTWGGGIYIYSGPIESLSLITHIDATSGLVSTAAGTGNPNYPVVQFMKPDDQGNLWMCNFNATNSNAIIARTPSNQWVHFSTNEGLRSAEVTVLEIEKTISVDRIWIGTRNNGVSVLDYQGTLLDKLLPEPDDWSGELDLDDGLLSTRVTALAQDRDGYMWIGTDKGLNYWFAEQVNSRFGLISDDIKVIGIDPANNKWIGTSAGISVLSGEDNFTILDHYTVENSPLVSNDITSFAFDPNTGEVWIGTTNGLSRLRTPYTAPRPDLKDLTGYPNPFLLDESTGVCDGEHGFRIANLAEDTAVKIYNVAGELVRIFSSEQIPGAQVCWDGRDESGELVPSGVYIYLAFIADSGIRAAGKVAVVRR